MKKISLRIKVTILTGIVIMVTSLTTAFYSTWNYKNSLKPVETLISANVIAPKEEEKEIPIDGMITSDENGKLETSFDLNRGDTSDSFSGEVNLTKSKNVEEKIEVYNYVLMDNLVSSNMNFIVQELAFSIVVSLISMLIAYFVSGYILKPIKELSDDISEISNMEKAQPLVVYNPNDEIGILTRKFNDLIEREKDYNAKQKLFASNVAHELKTPLSIMKLSLQILDNNSDLDEYKEAFDLQQKNIDRLTNIINDLLVLKENEYEIKEIRLDEVIKTVVNEQKKILDEKDISVHLKLEKLLIDSNQGLMNRLVSNLISNATKYNKVHGDIYIELDNDSLSIRDTGIGMDEKYLKDIFEPLFCIDKSRSRDLGGSGLGLSIVKNICDTLNYSIEVSSKIDCGSEFIIHFNDAKRSKVEKELM